MPDRSPDSVAPRRRSRPRLLAGLLAASMGAGVMAAGLVMPAVAGVRTATGTAQEAFDALPAELEEAPLSQQSQILYSDGSPMATFYFENRILVPLADIAPVMRDAVVAVEDRRFYEHGGIDPQGMARAAVSNAAGGDTQGASTLTQQWVKQVLVEQALSRGDEAAAQEAVASQGLSGYTRKLREAKLAIAAEQRLTKDEILERYLNIANYGDGQFGVETASRHWFSKSAKDLTLPDAALLAGIVQRPTAYDPVENPELAQERRDTVLQRMLATDVITQADYDAAVAVPLADQIRLQETPNGCVQAGPTGFFCDYVTKAFLADDAFGGTAEERKRLLYRGGLRITTTLDRPKQEAAVQEVNEFVPADGGGVGSAVVSVEPGTGRILAMAQNRTFDPASQDEAYATSLNFSTDQRFGGSGGFQPGSNFKPFVLAAWLASGRKLNDTVDATKRAYPNSSWKAGACDPAYRYTSEPYAPGNAGDGNSSGRMTVMEATYKSVNTAYVAMENQLQLCDVRDMAQRLGVFNADGSDLGLTPSMALGVQQVSPLSMANAYAAFAAEGLYCRPVAVLGIKDADGRDLPVPDGACEQRLDPNVAKGVNFALQNTLTQGTARGNALSGRTAAGKTGTTNESRATWFTGYTPQLSTSVWIGFPRKLDTLNGKVIDGQRRSRMYGATISAPTWRAYMNRALDGAEVLRFANPPGSLIGAAPRREPTERPTTRPRPRPSQTSEVRAPEPEETTAPEPEEPAEEPAPEPEPEPSTEPEPAPEPAPEDSGDGGNGDGQGNGNG